MTKPSSKLVKTLTEFAQDVNTTYKLTHVNSVEELATIIDGDFLVATPERKTMTKLGHCQNISYAAQQYLAQEDIASTIMAQKLVEYGQTFLHFILEIKENKGTQYVDLLKNIYLTTDKNLVLQKKTVTAIKGYHRFEKEHMAEQYTAFWNSEFTKDWSGKFSQEHVLNIYNSMPDKTAQKPSFKLLVSDTLQK